MFRQDYMKHAEENPKYEGIIERTMQEWSPSESK